MKRFFDIFLAIIILPIIFFPCLTIICLIRISSKGPAIHWSKRIGKDKSYFFMPKFRTLRVGTPQKATHLLDNPGKYYTPMGKLLRRTSLDELPQIWSILVGEMSFVGPRPALYNQYDLVKLREEKGINSLVPGLTGWAQINGRDEISVEEKVALDLVYLKKSSIRLDMIIIFNTAIKALKSEEVAH